ncbi:MAG: LytTR family DNA-binding domain-containing protein [Ruminococcus sp.]|nr:LytTR family DNA-binding domain-containing protein [Ruminococcus sp.]
MQRILIYDDSREQCNILKKLIGQLDGYSAEVSTAVTSDEAVRLLGRESFTAVFLDIELENDKNGISFADSLQERFPDISLIYITAHIKYCEDIFATSPAAFLLKPFTLEKVRRVMQIIEYKQQSVGTLKISSGGKMIALPLGNIAYMESIRRRLAIFDLGGKCIGEYYGITLADIREQLPDFFLHCHQSIYINMKQVLSLRRFSVTLKCGTELPISQSRYRESKQRYIEFLGDEI